MKIQSQPRWSLIAHIDASTAGAKGAPEAFGRQIVGTSPEAGKVDALALVDLDRSRAVSRAAEPLAESLQPFLGGHKGEIREAFATAERLPREGAPGVPAGSLVDLKGLADNLRARIPDRAVQKALDRVDEAVAQAVLAPSLALLLLLAACGPKGPASLGPAGPLQAPTSITRAPDGRLVIADAQGIVALDPGTKAIELLAKGEAQGAVVAPDGRLIATHADGTLTVDGRTVAEGLREPGRVAAWEGAAAVVEEGAVTRVDLATGEKSPITQLDDPVDLVVLEDGALLILDGFARTLMRYTPEGNQVVADLNAAASQPLGLGLLPDGQVLVVDRDTRRVMALDLSTGHRRLLDSPERGGPFGMSEYTDVEGLSDGAAAALSAPDAAVVRVHAEQGRQSLAGPEGSSEATAAIAFALARDGDAVYATDILGARLIRVDPKTGAFTEVSGRNAGSGVPLDLPVGLAVQGGTAWIGDPSQGVVRVDLATGRRERVSGPGRGSGPPMRAPGPLALHEGALYVADRGTRALYRVDLETGKRDVVAKDLKGPTAVASDGKRLLLADGDAVRDLSGQEVAEVTAPESLLPDAVGAEAEEAVAGHGLVLGLPSLKPLSGGRHGEGPPLDIPPGLVRLADGTVLAAQATGRGQIYRIDPRTGNRTALTLLPR